MELSLIVTPVQTTIKPAIARVSTTKSFNNVCIFSRYYKTNFNSCNPRSGRPIKGEIQALLMKNSVVADIEVKPAVDCGKSKQFELNDDMLCGRLVEDGRIFQQNFLIRSFDVGSDLKITIGNFMNYLQESILNQCKIVGLLADGFGRSPHMCERDLIWVARFIRMEVESYPSWGDVVQVDAWVYPWKNIGHRRNWHFCDSKTGKTLAKATSLYVLMNKTTRKLAKLENEIIKEWDPYVMKYDSIIGRNYPKLSSPNIDEADYVTSNLIPAFKDLDTQNHVSHLRYIDYLLQSVPRKVQESYELISITLEYRREAGRDTVMQSRTNLDQNSRSMNHLQNNKGLGFNHSLQLESGEEIVRARTEWKLKSDNIL